MIRGQVHYPCHPPDHQIARTERGWLKNVMSYSMFFHLEHHLFPAVPTCKLDRLAARLDEVCPEAHKLKVF
jgi:fatty acid desaturase